MNIEILNSKQDLESIEAGDQVVCEFHRDVTYKNQRIRLGLFTVYEVKPRSLEIILDKKMNIYFNYEMFRKGESNLKSIIRVTKSE